MEEIKDIQPHKCYKCGGQMLPSVQEDKKNELYKVALICDKCKYEFGSRVPFKEKIHKDKLIPALIEIWNNIC